MSAIRPPRTPGARAVCLVSGGMDSAVTLAEARAGGFSHYALTFRYGQRFACELDAARRVAASLGAIEHRVVGVELDVLGGSVLTERPGEALRDASRVIGVPKDRDPSAIGHGVPPTYVPARNTVFLSIALAWAEALGAGDLFLGVNAIDYSGYPDCRPAFLEAFETLAALATAAGAEEGELFRIHAPLLDLTKAGIVLRAEELGVDLGLTHTCYDPIPPSGGEEGERWLACGRCDACTLRLRGFAEAGRTDPIAYADGSRASS